MATDPPSRVLAARMPDDPRRFSIGLPRPLWIVVATLVLVVGAVGLRVGVPIYRQQVAIAEIERLGGSVLTSLRGPKWLRDAVGDERMQVFDEVDYVDLSDTPVTDATLEHIKALTGLKDVSLWNTQITDTGLAHLTRFTSLKTLALGSPYVTDAGLRELARFKNLTVIGLGRGNKVTKAGVAELQRALPGLNVLQ